MSSNVSYNDNLTQAMIDSNEPIYVSRENLQQLAQTTADLSRLIRDGGATENDLVNFERLLSITSRLTVDSN